ncbi:MAG TPA: zinc-dependent metalloprotease [Mycobacteriales bacterium]|nr:zinc-dependent metalloprotease [Mycobacteriales bacterium]
MTTPPFGFSGSGGDEPPPDEGSGNAGNPFAALGGNADLGAMLRQLGDLMSGESGPVNWQVARQTAMEVIGTDTGTTGTDASEVADAIRLADVWLNPVTALPSGVSSTEAWSRRRWLEATRPAWTELVEPVAARVSGAMGEALPEEMRAMAGPLMGMMSQVGGLIFGGQVGQALGTLATEVVSSSDIGLPLGPAGVAALLPESVRTLGAGLDLPLDEVRLFIALREAAHQRLFGHVPWLGAHLLAAVRSYAEGIVVDTSKFEELASGLDPSNPEAIQRAIGEGLFEPTSTPTQQAALARLETALALVEGWVDTVSAAAGSASLPSFGALQETMRRRRATGGPAERTFASLVGLELRPRRLREAATLWQTLGNRRGIDGRDAVWSHPDLLPSATDLDDPLSWVERGSTDATLDLSELESPPADESE